MNQPGGAGPDATGPWVTVAYTLRVNGGARPVEDAWLGESLLDVLRDRLGLTAAKDGCGEGRCGACTVLLDGRPVAACLVPAATVGDREVVTLEGLCAGGTTPAQRALVRHGAVQCGFCVPGIAVTAHALLAGEATPGEDDLRDALDGHPCRCAGPGRALAALRDLAGQARPGPAAGGPGVPAQAEAPPASAPAAPAAAPAPASATGTGTTGEFRVVLTADTAATGEFRIVVPPDVGATGSFRTVAPGEGRRGRTG